jgi:hypothetical protein
MLAVWYITHGFFIYPKEVANKPFYVLDYLAKNNKEPSFKRRSAERYHQFLNRKLLPSIENSSPFSVYYSSLLAVELDYFV